MKKTLTLLSLLIIGFVGLSLLSLYAVMQTRHAPQAVSVLFETFTPYQVKAQQARYTPPLQLTLEDVEIQAKQRTLQIPKLTLWLSALPWQQGKIALDSLLIEGATFDLDEIDSSLLDDVYLHQLALQHVDLSTHDWSAREVNVQIEQPQWGTPQQTLPFGDIQFAAKQLYVRGEALNDVLVDAKYQAQESTIYGSSFKWHGADISGQAEQFDQGWSLINVTIFNLNLDSVAPANKMLTTLKTLDFPVYHINSLDILRSNLNFSGWHFEQLDASLEDINLEKSLWQQASGYFSFDAESLSYDQIRFISPTAEVGFSSTGIKVDLFNADFKDGWVQLKGEISPSELTLEELRMSGITWLEGLNEITDAAIQASEPIQSLTIKELEVKNSQFIQVEQRPYWQLSGLTIDGRNLNLIKQGQAGLFDGQLQISANNASLDNLLTTQAAVEVNAKQRKVILERAFLPLKSGYIEANGMWNGSTISAPWNLVLHADGIPTDQPILQSMLPFSLQGLAEVELELSGLSGDYSMLAHSLSGKTHIQIHQGILSAKSVDGESSFEQNWPLARITASADRGRIQIESKSDNAQMTGVIDLTKPEFATLLFETSQQCQRLWSDIFSRTNVIEDNCEEEVAPPAVTSGAEDQETGAPVSSSVAL
ncbi:AsmA family protein [Vibrio atypicus]|uniref:AsmA family protein n=1 Tax=Vibrio atypicus TaxID=558271 RepID=UPI0037354CAD